MKFLFVVIIALLAFAIYKLLPALLKNFAIRELANGNNDKAESLFETAADLFGGNNQYKVEYALLLMRNGKYKDAEKILNVIILDRSVPQKNKINAKTYRAMSYHKQGRTEEALEEMTELYETVKTTVVYGLLGYLKQLDGASALDFCEEAYDYNSDDRDICDNLLVALIREGRLEKADEIASDLREKYPQFVEGFYHSAMLELKKGNKERAEEFLEKTQDCRRSMLTTVSVEDIEKLKEEIKNA